MRWHLLRAALVAVLVLATAGAAHATHAQSADSGEALGMFDPNTGIWTLTLPNGDSSAFYYGNPGDVPMMGDWDCHGGATVGMYRPSNGFVYVRNSNDFGVADYDFFYGNPGDVPVAGDWDGDGCTTLAIHRDGVLYVSNRLVTGFADFEFAFGQPGHIPFSSDFNGDGKDSIGFFDPVNARVYWRDTLTAGAPDVSKYLGVPGDQLVAGDWGGQGFDSNAVVRGGVLYYETPEGIVEWAVGGRGIAVSGLVPFPFDDGVLSIMPVGNSITEGNDGEFTYRFFLYNDLVRDGLKVDMVGTRTGVCCDGLPADPNFDQDHQAWAGARSGEIVSLMSASEAVVRPDIAIVHVGTNDIWGPPAPGSVGTDPANPNPPFDVNTTKSNLEALIAGLRRSNADADVVLSTLLPCDLGLVCSERIPALNDMIRSLPEELSTRRSTVVVAELDGVVNTAMLTDGVHPNKAGYEAMADVYRQAVLRLLRLEPLPPVPPVPVPEPPKPPPTPPPGPVAGWDDVVDILDRLEATQVGGRAQSNVNNAESQVRQALDDDRWSADRVLQRSVMSRLSEAAEQVERALERLGSSHDGLSAIESDLVVVLDDQAAAEKADAEAALNGCGNCGGARELLEDANDHYAQAIDYVAEGKIDEAGDRFRSAWDLAHRSRLELDD